MPSLIRSAGLAGVVLVAALAAAGAARADAFVVYFQGTVALGERTTLAPGIHESSSGEVGFGAVELFAPSGVPFESDPVTVSFSPSKYATCNEATTMRLGFQGATSTTVVPEAGRVRVFVSRPSHGKCFGTLEFSPIGIRGVEVGTWTFTLGGTSRIVGAEPGLVWATIEVVPGG